MKITTSDGISMEDWDIIKDLAAKIANASENEDDLLVDKYEEIIKQQLTILQDKYGELPSILATYAYYVDDLNERVRILQKAYEIACKINDLHNLTSISDSLAYVFIEDLEEMIQGKVWLNKLEKNLNNYYDKYDAEDWRRLKKLVEDKN